MQLVEQGFEFVVGDLVAGTGGRGRGGWLGGRSSDFLGGTGELALAVQLIEQRLEFVVGDLVTAACYRRFGRRLLANGVQQLLELVVGDVVIASCSFGDRLRLDGAGQLFFALRLGQTRKRRQQLGGRGSRLGALAHLAEHLVDRVQRLQDHIHQLGSHAALTLAQDVEHVFCDVAALHQLVELQEARATLDGVEAAENGIEQVHVIGSAFQLDQLLGQQLKNFAGLYQEVLEDFFIGVEAHRCAPKALLEP